VREPAGAGGALILVGTPIGNLGDLSPRAVDALRDADVIAAEDTRRTRALLSHAGIPAGRRLRAVHAHNERRLAATIVEEVRGGARVVYATDAGMPGISDPGERLVRACLDAGLAVEIVPGPSALLTGLVVSGLPTQRFVFEGFLPRKGKVRAERLAAIAAEPRTVVLYESPIRISGTLGELAAVCGPDREVAVARELTKRFEEVWRGRLGDAVADPGVVGTRGEFVVIVAPAPAAADVVADDGLEAAVDAALDSGLSARDAAAQVAAALSVPKRRAYDAATRRSRARARS
jgi:16S rRNA (cytidine1402-2'-O)-methyltransferase